jgi:hypothetical protein
MSLHESGKNLAVFGREHLPPDMDRRIIETKAAHLSETSLK